MTEGLTPGDPLKSPDPQPSSTPPGSPPPGYSTPPGYATTPPPGAGGPVPAGVPASGQYVLAGYGKRVGAYLIDALIVTAVAVVIMAPLGVGFFSVDSDTGTVALVGAAILGFFVFAIVALLYAPVMMWRTNGKTVGRMAAGTRVIRADGQRMTFGTAMIREVVLKALTVGIASSIIPLLPFLIDVLWPLWDDENRALHDFPVNTRTIVD